MSKLKIDADIEKVLKEYISIFRNGKGTSSSFAARIRAIERALMQNNDSLKRWFGLAMSATDSYQEAMGLWEEAAPTASTPKVGSSWKAAYHKLVLFVLGQYDADLYMALCDKHNDLELCKLVARHALFCTIAVADDVKRGKLGSADNKKSKGNDYFSWFDCKYQRKQGQNQQRRHNVIDAQGNNIQFHNHGVIFDDNTQANLAIKNAINEGLVFKHKNAKFEGYMACHIWDNSCHDYHFHTSVFNLVLLPKSIGGLSDYNDAVKRLLQYESAMRFGVYPAKYNSIKFNKPPRYYKEVGRLWRQPEEYEKAKNRIKQKQLPNALP